MYCVNPLLIPKKEKEIGKHKRKRDRKVREKHAMQLCAGAKPLLGKLMICFLSKLKPGNRSINTNDIK